MVMTSKPEAVPEIVKYARELRRKMRRELGHRTTDDEQIAICLFLHSTNRYTSDYTFDYTFDHLPMHEGNVDDGLISKLELLAGPHGYTVLRAFMAKERVS